MAEIRTQQARAVRFGIEQQQSRLGSHPDDPLGIEVEHLGFGGFLVLVGQPEVLQDASL